MSDMIDMVPVTYHIKGTKGETRTMQIPAEVLPYYEDMRASDCRVQVYHVGEKGCRAMCEIVDKDGNVLDGDPFDDSFPGLSACAAEMLQREPWLTTMKSST